MTRGTLAALLFVLLCAPVVRAENPRGVVFVASTDHAALVTRYDLEIYTATGQTPVKVLDLGKPAPTVDTNEIAFMELRPVLDALAPGAYVLRVAAVGLAGAGRTPATEVFAVSAPCVIEADGPVNVLVLGFDATVARSNPSGALIRFEASSDQPVVRVELDLEGDGEPSIEFAFKPENRRDGRYARALAFKPVVNGTWPLVVTAFDAVGRKAVTRCAPGITVGF